MLTPKAVTKEAERPRGAGIAGALVWALLMMTASSAARAEPAPDSAARERAWSFFEAFRTYRHDLDTTLPGEHGEVLLLERLRGEPPWLLRASLRLARNPEALTLLARRAGRSGDESLVPALRQAAERTPSLTPRRALELALVRLGDEETLLAQDQRLHQGSPAERWEAAAALGAAGARGVGPLTRALEDPDIQTRLASASALAAGGDARAQRLLRGLLESSNPHHRLEAAHALALAGDPRAAAPLREKLQHVAADRRRLVRSLGRVGGPEERRLLVGTFSSLPRGRSLDLRRELLIALGRIATRAELSELRGALDEQEEREDVATLEAWLESIGWAVTQGAREPGDYPQRLRESVEHPLLNETPVAHRLRRLRVEQLLAALAGEPPPPPTGRHLDAPIASLEQWLRATNLDDPAARGRRFDAAATLLVDLGEALGAPARSDPPEGALPVGLNVERAIDGNPMTAWFAGEMAGPLRLDLRRPRAVKALHLIGGCVESREDYRRHGRVKTVRVTLSGDRQIEGHLVDGDPSFQRIALPGVPTDRLSIEVTETYPGERQDAPACIPELRLQ